MFIVGLTGGIASGKSLVADKFAELGIEIIDADVIARALVTPGQSTLTAITQHFGNDILHPDGTLNRRALREIIFQDAQQRFWLESLLHPLIRSEINQQIKALQSPYGIVVIPLLTDRLVYPMLQRVLLVDAPEHLQLSRVQARDQISLVQAKAILSAQTTREQRLALADDIIINDAATAQLDAQVLALHKRYLAYASQT